MAVLERNLRSETRTDPASGRANCQDSQEARIEPATRNHASQFMFTSLLLQGLNFETFMN